MQIAKYEIRFQKRASPLIGRQAITIRLIFFTLALLFISLFLFIFSGIDPITFYSKIFYTNLRLFPSTLGLFITLALISIGLAIPFKARVDNIGAEGQYIMGMIAAYGTAYFFPDLPAIILIPLMFINGFILGALWAIPVAIFRTKGGFQGSDVVVSFLMVFPALYALEYLVSGPWRNPETGFASSAQIVENARIPKLDFSIEIPFTDIFWNFNKVHITIFLVFTIMILLHYMIFKYEEGIPNTKLGYEISVMGKNPSAGRMAGLSFFKIVLITMIISGGLAGIAGVGELAGNQLQLLTYTNGYGYTAIAIAYLGGLSILGILFAALFFAALFRGGIALQSIGLPESSIDLFSGIILFFVLLAEFFFRYELIMRFKKNG